MSTMICTPGGGTATFLPLRSAAVVMPRSVRAMRPMPWREHIPMIFDLMPVVDASMSVL